MKSLLTPFALLAFAAASAIAATGDVQFGVVGSSGALTSQLVTPGTPPAVFGIATDGGLKSFSLGTGLTVTGGSINASGGSWADLSGVPATITSLGSLTNSAGVLSNNGTGTLSWGQVTNAQLAGSIATSKLSVSANVKTVLDAADFASIKTALSLTPGTDVQAQNSVLQTLADGGTLSASQGGTGMASYTVGDILYASSTGTLAKVAGNTSTTRKVLTSTGTGSAATPPAWTDPDTAILQATIMLQTATTPGTDAAPPADLLITSSGVSGPVTGHVYITVGATTFVFSFFGSDPSDGSYFTDSTSFTSDYDLLNALTTALNTVGTGATASFDGVTITLHYTATGSSAVLTGSNDFGFMSFTGGGTGTDATPGSGGITDQGMIAAVAGKKIGLIRAWAAPATNSITSGKVRLSLYNPATSTWTAIGEATISGTAFVEIQPSDKAVNWGVGKNAGETLRATLVDSTDASGTTINLVALFQRL